MFSPSKHTQNFISVYNCQHRVISQRTEMSSPRYHPYHNPSHPIPQHSYLPIPDISSAETPHVYVLQTPCSSQKKISVNSHRQVKTSVQSQSQMWQHQNTSHPNLSPKLQIAHSPHTQISYCTHCRCRQICPSHSQPPQIPAAPQTIPQL